MVAGVRVDAGEARVQALRRQGAEAEPGAPERAHCRAHRGGEVRCRHKAKGRATAESMWETMFRKALHRGKP